jgi:signal transduction histidine kinase
MNERIRILYVDDSLLDRELVRDSLEQEHGGFEVIEARNRAEFVERLAEGPVDLVLTDFDIVGFKGLQVLAMVHEKYPDIPVIVVTGTGSEEVAVEAMKRGAADYVIKSPHHIRRLPFTIMAALKNNQLAQEREQYYQALHEREKELKVLNEELEERVRQRTAALEQRNEEVRRLASALTLAEHEERGRLALLLHEDLQQILFGMRIRIHILLQELSTLSQDQLRDLIEGVGASTERAIDVAQTLSIRLNPPAFKGEDLREALQWLVHHMMERYSLIVHLRVQGNCQIPQKDKRILLIQLIRELLFNVVEHADVKEAFLEASNEEAQLIIRVKDQGVGFEVQTVQQKQSQNGSMGLVNISERLSLLGGHLQLTSSPGQGTEVTVVVPLQGYAVEVD